MAKQRLILGETELETAAMVGFGSKGLGLGATGLRFGFELQDPQLFRVYGSGRRVLRGLLKVCGLGR